MAITRVQYKKGSGQVGGTPAQLNVVITLDSTPIVGNLLIALIAYSGSLTSVNSVTTTNVTWSKVISKQHMLEYGNTLVEIWKGVIGSSPNQATTINFASSAYQSCSAVITEYSGLTGDVDKTASNACSAVGTSSDSGTTSTTAFSNELWIACTGGKAHAISQATLVQSNPTNSFSLVDQIYILCSPWGWGATCGYEEKIVSSTGTANTGTTYDQSTDWIGAIVTFKGTVTIPTVTTQAVSSIEEITSTGNGNITATFENCDKRGICWNTSGSPTIADFKTEESGTFGTGAFTEAMTSLSPGTLYYVKAYAHNSAGYGYGNEVTFTTKPNPPTSLASTAKTKNSISLSWSKGSGAVTTMIRYRTDQYPTGPTDGSQGYSDTGSSGTVGSLSSGQIYYFRAWSYNAASPSSGYSDDYSSVTEYTRPDDPSAFACSVINSHEIDLSWSKGTGGDKTMIRRKIDSYPTSVSDGDQVYLDTGTSYNNTGLVGGVHYYYRAWAYDTDSEYYSDNYSQDEDTTTTPILPIGKLIVLDKENKVFRINPSDLSEEKLYQ